VSVTDLEKVTA